MKTPKTVSPIFVKRRSVAWVRFERQRGRMRGRSSENRRGRKSNVRKKAKLPKRPGRLAARRKMCVRRIWLDTVLAGERERLINIQIHMGMMQCGESFNQPPVVLNLHLQVPTYAGTEIDHFLSGRSGKVGSEKVRLE